MMSLKETMIVLKVTLLNFSDLFWKLVIASPKGRKTEEKGWWGRIRWRELKLKAKTGDHWSSKRRSQRLYGSCWVSLEEDRDYRGQYCYRRKDKQTAARICNLEKRRTFRYYKEEFETQLWNRRPLGKTLNFEAFKVRRREIKSLYDRNV